MGRRKQIVQECESLMNDPEHIRNIAIAAHVDHGKCVAGDTRISLADGTVVDAASLFERVKADGEPTADQDGEAYVPAEDLSVATFDRTAGETTTKPIDYAVKRSADESLVQLTTSNGHAVSTTPEHRCLILNDRGVMEYKRSDEVSEGDVLVGIRKVPARADTSTKAALIRELADVQEFVVDVSERLATRIGDEATTEILRDSDTDLDPSSIDHAVRHGEFPLHDIVIVCQRLEIGLEELYEGLQTIRYR
ncbi:MAG: hypothetical protein ABEH64_11965, partial [Salinirussus sp.]